MKKVNVLLTAVLFLGGLTIASCDGGEGSKKASPEDEVREFGKYFIEKLAANQLDSLAGMYEGIALADTILPIQSDTVVVSETGAGQYDVDLGEGVTLKLRREDDGKIVVTESFRLFAFPEDKVEIAKKTGMWDESLNDASLAERLNDEEFFDYVKNQIKKRTSNILSVIEAGTGFYEDSYVYIQNNTDQQIDGSDYTIHRRCYDYTNTGAHYTKHFSEKGRAISPKGRIKIICNMAPDGFGDGYVESVKMKLSQEQIQEKFAPYTGKEYQEYLDSKK